VSVSEDAGQDQTHESPVSTRWWLSINVLNYTAPCTLVMTLATVEVSWTVGSVLRPWPLYSQVKFHNQ
jgi:hypothetical protein